MAQTGAKRKRESDDNQEFSLNVKRTRVEDEMSEREEDGTGTDNILSSFTTFRIIKDSAREKKIHVHGKLAGMNAVIVLEKTPITEDILPEIFTSSHLKLDMKNETHTTYHLQAPAHLNEIKTTVMCPASSKLVRSYKCQERYLVEERWEDYHSITLPYIIKHKNFCVPWIHNILNKRAEADRIVFEDPHPRVGFVLVPDYKWDQKQMEDLYLLAIARRRDIRSLRDLTGEHLPLLYNIFQKGTSAILQRYNMTVRQLSIYVHYQPSHLHFHVHFTKLGYEAPGCGVERAHLLPDVIQNIQSNPEYYQTRTLYFPLWATDKLLSKFREAGRL